MAEFVSGVGPLFGPDFLIVTVNDETGKPPRVQVNLDAHNPELNFGRDHWSRGRPMSVGHLGP